MALSIDASATGTKTGAGNMVSGTLTLGSAGDIIVVAIHLEAVNGTGSYPTVTSVSDATNGSTYARRGSPVQFHGGLGTSWNNLEIWWVYSPTTIASAVTVVIGGGTLDDGSMRAFGVKGFTGTTYQTSPWDQAVASPPPFTGTSTTSSAPSIANVSTVNAATMIIGVQGDPTGGARSVGTFGGVTCSQIGQTLNTGGTNNSSTYVEYLVESAAQTNITCTAGSSSNGWCFFVDALSQAGSGAAPSGKLFLPPGLDGLSAGGPFFANPLARSMLGWRPGLLMPRRRLAHG